MEFPKPGREHDWLLQLVGDWRFTGECLTGPDQPPAPVAGVESVRSLGGFWIIGDASAEAPGSDAPHRSVLTIGFNPETRRFVGSFVASMMTTFWLYDGALDETGTRLVLEAEGPSMTGGTALFRDVYAIVSPDHKRLTSSVMQDGAWVQFLSADYRRA